MKTTSRLKTVREYQQHTHHRAPSRNRVSIRKGERDKFSNGDYFKNKRFLSKDEIKEVKNIVGLDMGAATMASAVLLKGNTRRSSAYVRLNRGWCGSKNGLTRGYVDNHCGTRSYRQWLDKAKRLDGNILTAERAVSAASSRKCLALGDLENALILQFQYHATMVRFYRSNTFCKHRLLLKSRHRRFVDSVANRLVRVAEKHSHRNERVTFAIGNCIDHPCSRGHRGGGLANSKFVKALARIRRVVLIDEYNTTKRYVHTRFSHT